MKLLMQRSVLMPFFAVLFASRYWHDDSSSIATSIPQIFEIFKI